MIHNNDYSKEVNSLMDFAQKRMGFSNRPKVLFTDDPKNASKPLGKTGYYDPNSAEIRIFMTGRHIKDILRSLAHELVHHMQNEKGSLHHDGYMGAGYAQKNPKMREMEREAYEMGNLCFRDWEDGLKENHPTIYNERRNHKMSLKDWKNKELMENLIKKWGFKSNLNESMHGEDGSSGKPHLDYGSLEEEESDLPDTPPPMPSNPEGLPFQEKKQYDLEENQDRIFAPSHYCAHHVIHEGKEGYTVDHNYNTILKRVTRYDVKFADGTIKRNIHESKLTVLEAFTEGEHKRDEDHPKVKKDEEVTEEENKKMVKGPDGKMVPDYAADGKGDNDLAKGKQSKDSEKSEDESEEKSSKKESPKKGKMPPGLAKYHAKKKGDVKESLRRKIRVNIKK